MRLPYHCHLTCIHYIHNRASNASQTSSLDKFCQLEAKGISSKKRSVYLPKSGRQSFSQINKFPWQFTLKSLSENDVKSTQSASRRNYPTFVAFKSTIISTKFACFNFKLNYRLLMSFKTCCEAETAAVEEC